MPRCALRCDSSPDNKAPDNSIDVKKPANSECELTYDVLTIIFKKLNARDLRNAARVCRCWSEVAENEKRVREDSTLTLIGEVADSWSSLHRGELLVDRLRMKPMLGLTFTNRLFDARLVAKENKTDCPCGSLPSTCSNIIVGNRGLISDQTEYEFEGLIENRQKVACIFLPDGQDVTVKTMCIPLLTNEKNEEPSHGDRQTLSRTKKRLKKFLTVEDKVESIILLSCGYDPVAYYALENIPRDRYESLWGGNVGNLAICKWEENRKVCTEPLAFIGILISGPGVRSWGIVLGAEYNTKEKVEVKLKLLKNQVQLKKHSAGFIFACTERGESMFGEKNVESTIFKKLFPEVSLIGSSGNGEFGDSAIEPMERRTHSYSSVYMILTYG